MLLKSSWCRSPDGKGQHRLDIDITCSADEVPTPEEIRILRMKSIRIEISWQKEIKERTKERKIKSRITVDYGTKLHGCIQSV